MPVDEFFILQVVPHVDRERFAEWRPKKRARDLAVVSGCFYRTFRGQLPGNFADSEFDIRIGGRLNRGPGEPRFLTSVTPGRECSRRQPTA